jgi:hypothetical protein
MEEKIPYSESLNHRLDLVESAQSLKEIREIIAEDIPVYDEETDANDEIFVESANLRFMTYLAALARGMDLNALNDQSRVHLETMKELALNNELRAKNRATILVGDVDPTVMDKQYYDKNLEIITQLIESLKPGILHSDTQYKVNLNPEGPDAQSIHSENRFAARLSADLLKLAENGYKEIAAAGMLLFHYRHALGDGYYGATHYDLTPNRSLGTVLKADDRRLKGFTSVQWYGKTEEEIRGLAKHPWSKNIKFVDRRLALAERYMEGVKDILGINFTQDGNSPSEQMLSLLCAVMFENMSNLRYERNDSAIMPEGKEIPLIYSPQYPEVESMRYKILHLIAKGDLDNARSLIEHRVTRYRTLTNPRVAYIARLNLPEDFFGSSLKIKKQPGPKKLPKDSL